MNVPCKYLASNDLQKDKIQFYQKLSSKYITAFTKYHKQNKSLKNYKEDILRWLFSFNVNDRMIICSVENKQLTNILQRIYVHHLAYTNYHYKIHIEKEEYDKAQRKTDSFDIDDRLINEIRFYQCESSISNYALYSNYFTLSQVLLEDEELFKLYFNSISNDKCFLSPIKTSQDFTSKLSFDYPSSKSSLLHLPDWFENEGTLAEHFVAVIEQSISIRYIISCSSSAGDLNEVYASSYLKELLERKKDLEDYLASLKASEGYFNHFNLEQLVKEMHNNDELANFIASKPLNAGKRRGWFANPQLFNHVRIDKDIEVIRKWFDEHFNDNNSSGTIVKVALFFHISKLFTYDDFLFRGIISAISYKYHSKNSEDLLLYESQTTNEANNQKKKKKKKKNRAKEATPNQHIKSIVFDLVNASVDNSTQKYKAPVTKYLEDKPCMPNGDGNKSNEKVKPLFLFNTVKSKESKKKKKTATTSNVIISTSSSSEESKPTQSGSNMQIVHNENQSYIQTKKKNAINTINSSNFHLSDSNKDSSIDKGSVMLLHHNPMSSLIDKLSKDIDLYYSQHEEFLAVLLKIKYRIIDYLTALIKKFNLEAIIQVYGSCRHGLDIESSDLDLSITSANPSIGLIDFLPFLSNSNAFDSIMPVFTATVPVIKLQLNPLKLKDHEIDSFYKEIASLPFYSTYLLNKTEIEVIRIDLTLNSVSIAQIDFISNSIALYPEIKSLLKIMKRLLQLNDLNIPYHGGLCSYSLFLLIYSYVKWSSCMCGLNRKADIGALFIEVLMHYGFILDFTKTIIDPKQLK